MQKTAPTQPSECIVCKLYAGIPQFVGVSKKFSDYNSGSNEDEPHTHATYEQNNYETYFSFVQNLDGTLYVKIKPSKKQIKIYIVTPTVHMFQYL